MRKIRSLQHDYAKCSNNFCGISFCKRSLFFASYQTKQMKRKKKMLPANESLAVNIWLEHVHHICAFVQGNPVQLRWIYINKGDGIDVSLQT